MVPKVISLYRLVLIFLITRKEQPEVEEITKTIIIFFNGGFPVRIDSRGGSEIQKHGMLRTGRRRAHGPCLMYQSSL